MVDTIILPQGDTPVTPPTEGGNSLTLDQFLEVLNYRNACSDSINTARRNSWTPRQMWENHDGVGDLLWGYSEFAPRPAVLLLGATLYRRYLAPFLPTGKDVHGYYQLVFDLIEDYTSDPNGYTCRPVERMAMALRREWMEAPSSMIGIQREAIYSLYRLCQGSVYSSCSTVGEFADEIRERTGIADPLKAMLADLRAAVPTDVAMAYLDKYYRDNQRGMITKRNGGY